jgi:hypothetical protein
MLERLESQTDVIDKAHKRMSKALPSPRCLTSIITLGISSVVLCGAAVVAFFGEDEI